jgi:N-acetylated-alpha-linked acidic dipeptidase
VIATLHGSEFPDEWIIRGNHYDAWVNGAEDPISGQVALLEEARAFGELLKKGWKPKRTIVYCAWDGEEEGLLGSTEWAEEHSADLKQKAVIYINSDGNGRGYLGVAGSHSLEKFVNDIAREIEDPETKLTVWKRYQLKRISQAAADERQELRGQQKWRIGALGSGSDYTAFLDFLGIASLDIGFGGEDGSGIYHSIYDDFYWYTHFSDTSFAYGVTLSQTVGTAVMRFADEDLLPFEFTNEASTIKRYSDEIQKLLLSKQEELREQNQEIDEGVFTATVDPKVKMIPPNREETPPYLNFAPLQNAVDVLSKSAERYHRATLKVSQTMKTSFESVNRRLIESERKLTAGEGLPGRPWYKHQIYAPGFYTGYGVKTIPAVREAIEQKQWKLAEAEILKVADVLEGEADDINAAAAELEKIVHE